MPYLKHNSNNRRSKPKAAKKPDEPVKIVVTGPEPESGMPTPSMQHDLNYVEGLEDIEASLDWIARGISRLTSDDHVAGLSFGQGENTYPIKLTLADNDFDDTMGRLVAAVERIADSAAKLAGLNRPRLESWHEQDEYEPRYKEIAVDGGAPGPSAEVQERLKRCNTAEGQKS